MDLNNQEMQTIISSYMIQPYIILSHPNSKKRTSRYKVICGCECCISAKSIIIIMALLPKYQSFNTQKRRSDEMDNHVFETYKILSCNMVSICSKQHPVCLRKQCNHVHHQNIHYYNGNVFCSAVNKVHAFIY